MYRRAPYYWCRLGIEPKLHYVHLLWTCWTTSWHTKMLWMCCSLSICCGYVCSLLYSYHACCTRNPQQVEESGAWVDRSIDRFAQSMSVTKRCHPLTAASLPPHVLSTAPWRHFATTQAAVFPARHRSLHCFDALSNSDNEHAPWNSIILLLWKRCKALG